MQHEKFMEIGKFFKVSEKSGSSAKWIGKFEISKSQGKVWEF